MKRLGILLGSILLGVGVITTSAFAYFNFSENSITSKNTDTQNNYVNNIKFDNTTTVDRTFNLYFFASPYYATGSDTSNNEISWSDAKSISPLDICNMGTSNPYNDTSDCKIAGMTLEGSDASKYANVIYNSGGYAYISLPEGACNVDDSGKFKVDEQDSSGNYIGISKYYKTRDFTGYLTLYNNGSGGQEGTLITDSNGNYIDIDDSKIYTYYKITVTGGIKADQLNKIIANTEFKDRYGFGPEFMGWTYNKQECFNRVTYTKSSDSSINLRYIKNPSDCGVTSSNNNVMSTYDNKGWGISWGNMTEQIGNYGDNTEVSILSADDSLIYINSLGVDGSSKNDNNIFLYPVFGSKNMIKHNSGSQSPILKMRTNPITDETDDDYYKYHQKGEIDYDYSNETDSGRFTSYFNYIPEATIDANGIAEPNYTLKNFYVNQSTDDDKNYINNYQLDVNFTKSNKSWTDSWYTLINSKTLADSIKFYDDYFKTYGGYFDIDIYFVQSTTYTFTSLKYPENYINDVTKVNTDTITVDNTSYSFSYIIGIKRDNTLKITGLTDSNSIFDYNSGSKNNSFLYKSSVIHEDDSDSSIWYYFTSNSIKLSENQDISVMIQNALNLKDTHDLASFTYMNDERLETYNNALTSSSFIENKTKYKACDENAKLVSKRETYTATNPNSPQSTLTIENFPIINTTEEGTYELLIAVNYSKGFPYNIEVGYREIATDNVLLVLNTMPSKTSNGYLYSEIYETYSDNIVCEGTFQNNTIITTSTEFSNDNKISISDTTEIIDLATGIDVTSLISNGKFYSTRNMILYYKTK